MRFRSILIAGVLLAGCGSPQTTQVQPTARPSAVVVSTAIAVDPLPTAIPTLPPFTSTSEPVIAQQPSATPPAPTIVRTIELFTPKPNAATQGNQLTVEGSTNFLPFENSLGVRILNEAEQAIGTGSVQVMGEMQPNGVGGGTFSGSISFTPPSDQGAGYVEVFDTSAQDGSILALARVPVRFGGQTPPPAAAVTIDAPATDSAALPLHIAFRGAGDTTMLNVSLLFDAGGSLEATADVTQGYGTLTLNWNLESQPPTMSGPATLRLVQLDGTVVAERRITILDRTQTQFVKVAWLVGEEIVLADVAVPKTNQVGAAALNALLAGPHSTNAAGFTTALPSTREIITYGGRQPGWGYHVRLLDLKITDGVATANFSPELEAYGGGTVRVSLLHRQIEQTLRQFPSVQRVVIAVAGQTEGILQP